MMDEIIENQVIGRIAKAFQTPPCRLNRIHEADAEIIDLGEGSDKYLAVTTDALVEEVSSGLYADPYLVGWMLAMVNFSDLAAVGAEPVGLLIALNLSPREDEAYVARLAEGISDACRELGTFVLGGDTNEAKELLLSGSAFGLVPKDSTISRMGAQPGDRVYLSGPAGLGNVYAFLRLTRPDLRLPGSAYRPVARIKQGRIVRGFGSSCMDTSDGVVHTVDTLMRLNRCRFVLNDSWEKTVHPLALETCRSQKLPPWLALAGVHGEFELCFTLSPLKEREFLGEAAAAGWAPVLIGEKSPPAREFFPYGRANDPPGFDLHQEPVGHGGSDQQNYIRQPLGYAQEIGI
jgi:thiamine-monophosphate kinase